jgi:hypothetical protein
LRISRKKCQRYQEQSGGLIEENASGYKVEGEVGHFCFKNHNIYQEDKNVMNTAKDVFRTLYSKEWYRTMSFNELALDFAAHMSYSDNIVDFKYNLFDVNNKYSKEELIKNKGIISAIFLLDQKIEPKEFLEDKNCSAIF